MKTLTLREVREYVEYACDEMDCPELAGYIRLSWNNRFTKRLGDARWVKRLGVGYIRLSSKLFPTMKMADQIDTVLHEAAHVITNYKYSENLDVIRNDRQGHGTTWCMVAERVGARPRRFAKRSEADFDKFRQKRTKKRYIYDCACAMGCRISSIAHGRIERGQLYRCRRCKCELNSCVDIIEWR